MPGREQYFFVCTNRRADGHPKGSCAERGSEEVVKKLKEGLAKRGLALTMRACSSSCLDLCDSGVSLVVEPMHIVYGRVTLEDVDELIEATREGRVVERLRVPGAAG